MSIYLHIGFTGTRRGMTDEQQSAVANVVAELVLENQARVLVGHHGDCVGADNQFHVIMRSFNSAIPVMLVIHPPVDNEHRAFAGGDEMQEPLTHMKRNKAIVEASGVMIGAPFEMHEQDRGGTWKTIRIARKTKRRLAIVYRDGTVRKEMWV